MSEGEQLWYIGVTGKGPESSDVDSVPLHSSSLTGNDAWRETAWYTEDVPYLLESEVPHIIVWANSPTMCSWIGYRSILRLQEMKQNPRVQYQSFRVKKVIDIFSLELLESSVGLQDL